MGRIVSPQIHIYPEPQNGTLSGKMAFEDLTKIRLHASR